jgi:protein SCO1/2
MLNRFLFALAALAVLSAGCEKSPRQSAVPNTSAHTNLQIFQVKGLVKEVNLMEKSVTIKHDEVTGYMPAMTMPFDVRDTNELAGIEPGDPVTFRLLVTDTEGWIDQIRKTGPKRNDPPTTGTVRLVRDVEPLSEGDLFPEYQFTNQFGKLFSTKEFQGQALAITFLFTRCPFPNYCPLMTKNFAAVQEKLSSMANGPTNWHLLTLSFDPEYDTPAVLRRYAEATHYDPQRWTFGTGPLIDITAIAEQFGLMFVRDQPGGLPNHNLRTAVISASGRVQKIFARNEWTPDELAAEMVKAAAAK